MKKIVGRKPVARKKPHVTIRSMLSTHSAIHIEASQPTILDIIPVDAPVDVDTPSPKYCPQPVAVKPPVVDANPPVAVNNPPDIAPDKASLGSKATTGDHDDSIGINPKDGGTSKTNRAPVKKAGARTSEGGQLENDLNAKKENTLSFRMHYAMMLVAHPSNISYPYLPEEVLQDLDKTSCNVVLNALRKTTRAK